MQAFRIADRRYPVFDGAGARITGGRWNSPGRPMIYASETFAGALLETLAHSNLGRVPTTHAVVEIRIPENIRIESIGPEDLSGWNAADERASRAWGDLWLTEQRSAVLVVPSTVTSGRERNVLLNPEHPDFGQISASKPQPVRWDERLFKHR
jgi:RES domain-containing protein